MSRLSFFVFARRVEVALAKIHGYLLSNFLVDELLNVWVVSVVLILLKDIHKEAKPFSIY